VLDFGTATTADLDLLRPGDSNLIHITWYWGVRVVWECVGVRSAWECAGIHVGVRGSAWGVIGPINY
jgi:hypothetical protein